MTLGSSIARDAVRGAEHAARGVDHAARIARLQQQNTRRAQQMAADLHTSTELARHPQGALAVQREPVNGDLVLQDTRRFIRHFSRLPSTAVETAAVLWTAASHARDEDTGLPVWMYAPRFFITAAEGGSGKTQLARLMAKLAPNGAMLIDPTKASLIDLIAEQSTVVISEANVILPSYRKLVGIANAGFEPDQYASKMVSRKPVKIPLMGNMILDGLDELLKLAGKDIALKTLMNRCVIVRMHRAENWKAPRFDRTARAIAERGSQRLARWMAQEVADGIGDVVPDVPELAGRRADCWEPLFATAIRAGGDWPRLCAEACVQLETAVDLPDEDEDSGSELDRILESWED